MSEKVIAISSEAIDCGKRVSDTKRKFVWKFKIGEEQYNLQLISSALSGKKVVTLNSSQIYSEQNVFNINFDFSHSVNGHSLRIAKEEDSMNSFDLRIDNRAFGYLLKRKKSYQDEMKKQKKTSKYENTENDPFSQFASFASSQPKQSSANDQFGDFADFDEFSYKKSQKKTFAQNQESKQQVAEQEAIIDAKSLKKIEQNLNSDDLLSSDFSTNIFNKNNNYLDLVSSRQAQSEQFGHYDPMKKDTTIDKMKLDLTGKQMMNKTKATAQQLKMKANDFFESLI